MSMSFTLIGSILGLLPFEGLMFMVLRSASMSENNVFISSSVLIPVSLRICKYVA